SGGAYLKPRAAVGGGRIGVDPQDLVAVHGRAREARVAHSPELGDGVGRAELAVEAEPASQQGREPGVGRVELEPRDQLGAVGQREQIDAAAGQAEIEADRRIEPRQRVARGDPGGAAIVGSGEPCDVGPTVGAGDRGAVDRAAGDRPAVDGDRRGREAGAGDEGVANLDVAAIAVGGERLLPEQADAELAALAGAIVEHARGPLLAAVLVDQQAAQLHGPATALAVAAEIAAVEPKQPQPRGRGDEPGEARLGTAADLVGAPG